MRNCVLLTLCFYSAWPLSAQRFFNASANLPASASGANMDVQAADLDHDGDLDLVFAREFQANFILRNNGAGVFTNATQNNLPQPLKDSEDVVIADFNADTHLDLVFCSEDNFAQGQLNVHEYYRGDGTAKFTIAGYQPPDSEANAVATSDINEDGFPDLVFGNNGTLTVLINDSTGNFRNESFRVPALIRTTQDVHFFHANNDGHLDIMCGNEDGNVLLINDGSGHYNDSSVTHLPQTLNVETRKIATADVDNDGDHDMFLANVRFIATKDPQNRLLLNDGLGHFTDATVTHLPADQDLTIEAIFEDLDDDGDPDLVLGNVFGAHVKAYANDGSGLFTDSTLALIGGPYQRDALAIISADLNGDQHKDLYIAHRKQSGTTKDILLLRSPTSSLVHSSDNAMQIFPNPSPGRVCFQGLEGKDAVRIYSMDGTCIFKEKHDSGCVELPISSKGQTVVYQVIRNMQIIRQGSIFHEN